MSEQEFEFVPGGNGRMIRVVKGAVLPSLPAPTPAPSDDEIEGAMMEIVHQAYAAIEAAPVVAVTLPDGTELAPVSPDVLVNHLGDWQNGHEGGGGPDKPRVFVLDDGVYQQINLLIKSIVTGVYWAVRVGNVDHRVYSDSTLWIEVCPSDVIEALDLLSVAGDLLADSPTPSAVA